MYRAEDYQCVPQYGNQYNHSEEITKWMADIILSVLDHTDYIHYQLPHKEENKTPVQRLNSLWGPHLNFRFVFHLHCSALINIKSR